MPLTWGQTVTHRIFKNKFKRITFKEMALVEQNKNGGPYTKNEQTDRRKEVLKLHFEKGYSAVKIADMLNVNRNTINDDIKYLNSQFSEEWKFYDVRSIIMKQIHRFELQRSRLLEELEHQEKFKEKIVIEKMILDIDEKILQIGTKIISSNYMKVEPVNELNEINEEDVKQILLHLIEESYDGSGLVECSKKYLKTEIIKQKKCDEISAEMIVKKMFTMGLGLCQSLESGLDGPFYDIEQFSAIRGYLSRKKISEFHQKKNAEIEKYEKLHEKYEKKFIKKYGPELEWPLEVIEKFGEGLESL